jgi:hypothetical protein
MLFSSRDPQHYQQGQGTQLLQEIASMLPVAGALDRARMTDSPLFTPVERFTLSRRGASAEPDNAAELPRQLETLIALADSAG